MKLFCALSLVALSATTASATAAQIFHNTSHADNAYLNWEVSTNTPPGTDGNYDDFLVNGPWTPAAACTNVPLTHGATSPVRLDWIANIASCSNSTTGGIGGTQWTQFIFRQRFTLTAEEAASLQLTFNWAADDSGQSLAFGGDYRVRGTWTPKWSLNSLAQNDLVPTLWPGSPAPGNTYVLSPTITVSGFTTGVNTMYFWVQGNGITDGMKLMNAEFSTKVPEPASLALVCLGLLGVSIARRCR